ncbi:MAG: hypothetical protein GTO14_24600 [Anaerolineales bacterium]|nr:hypothetical protein [Anaerolineales bacterium]
MRIKLLLIVCLVLFLASCEFPGVGTIGCSVTELIDAINNANATPATKDTIILAESCIYELTSVDNTDFVGSNGLPVITSPIFIVGRGSTIQRSSVSGTPRFRIFYVDTTGELELDGITLSNGNPELGKFGGAIFNLGSLSISATTLTGNQARDGGAIRNFLGTVTISHSTISDNQSVYGGGIANAGGDLTVSNSEFLNNIAIMGGESGGGGAIFNDHQSEGSVVAISGSTFSGNQAFWGGAIGNGQNGHVDIDDSSFVANEASNGGAITNNNALDIRGSTIANNTANTGGGIRNNWFLWLVNSTVSGNTLAPGPNRMGSAIYNTGGQLMISFATITDNSGAGGSSALYIEDAGGVGISSSIIAENTGGDCGFSTSAPAITPSGNNLDSDGSCTGFTLSANPQLGPLADNGGPTQTHALLPGSPAFDGAAPFSCLPTDQRGVYRPQGAECDLGAYELEVLEPLAITTPLFTLVPSPPTSTPTVTPEPAPFGTILVETLCWHGPGRDGLYEVVSALQPDTEVEILGVGGGEAAGFREFYVVVNNPRYNRPCWVLERDIDTDEDLDGLPVVKAPPLPTPTYTPTEVPPVGCMVPNQQKELECVYPCPDPDRWTTECTP